MHIVTHYNKVITARYDANNVLLSLMDRLSTPNPEFKNSSSYDWHTVTYESETVTLAMIKSLIWHQRDILYYYDTLVSVDRLKTI